MTKILHGFCNESNQFQTKIIWFSSQWKTNFSVSTWKLWAIQNRWKPLYVDSRLFYFAQYHAKIYSNLSRCDNFVYIVCWFHCRFTFNLLFEVINIIINFPLKNKPKRKTMLLIVSLRWSLNACFLLRECELWRTFMIIYLFAFFLLAIKNMVSPNIYVVKA